MTKFDSRQIIDLLTGGLIVSCQAHGDHPLNSTDAIVRMARCAELGGATALRLDSPEHVSAVRDVTALPIIALHKVRWAHRFAITPDIATAEALVAAGADVVAVDCAAELPWDGTAIVEHLERKCGVPVLADCSDLEEAISAWKAGATFVGTTLAGYTADQLPVPVEPDLELVRTMRAAGLRVVAEGRYHSPARVSAAFEAGAHAVCVGSAITDPIRITASFVAAPRGVTVPASDG